MKMKFNNNISIQGQVHISRFTAEGVPIDAFVSKNMVVQKGLEMLVYNWGGDNAYRFEPLSIGISDGVTATAATDVAMEGAVIETALLDEISQPASTPNVITYSATFAGSVYTSSDVNEIGLFFRNTGDVEGTVYMAARTVLPAEYRFEKGVDEYVKIMWRLTLGSW
jgi:hypothetical protein